MKGQPDLASLRRVAEANRERLLGQLRRTGERLAPGRLSADARSYAVGQVKSARDDTIAHVRQHPFRTLFGAGLIIAWLARKPLLARAPAAISAAYGWLSGNAAFTQSSLSDDIGRDETHGDFALPDAPPGDTDADYQDLRTET